MANKDILTDGGPGRDSSYRNITESAAVLGAQYGISAADVENAIFAAAIEMNTTYQAAYACLSHWIARTVAGDPVYQLEENGVYSGCFAWGIRVGKSLQGVK
jgi:hypothetical protein